MYLYNIKLLIYMKLSKSESPNKYIQKAQNQLITQQSIRLLQYINMYNLKRDQILYQCPIFKSQLNSQQFGIEVECIEQMADIQVIYNRQRRQQIVRIRNEQKLIQQKIQKQKKSQGFFSKLFSSKDKNKSNITPEKPKINMSLLRSSVYLSKNNMNSSSIIKENKLLNSVTTNFYANQSKLANTQIKQNNVTPGNNLDQTKPVQPATNNNANTNTKNIQPIPIPKPQDKPKPQPQKPQPKIQNQLIQQDIDIDDLLDVQNQSVEEKKIVKKMTSIKQQSEQDEKSRIKINIDNDSIIKQGSQGDSIRDSRVTRILKQQNQDLEKSKVSQKSKRITQRSRTYNNDEEQQQEKSIINKSQVSQSKVQNNEKDNKNGKQNGSSFKKKKAIDQIQPKNQKPSKIKSNLPQKPKKVHQPKLHNSPQPKNQTPTPIPSPKPKSKQKTKKQDPLQSYIQSQISRLTQKISDVDILSVDLLDVDTSNLSIKSQHKQQIRQDSYSDININWMVKLQSCEMQQKLLLNRIKTRWNKPMESIKKIRNLHMHHLTQQITNNPKYQFVRPNLNFGTIIQ